MDVPVFTEEMSADCACPGCAAVPGRGPGAPGSRYGAGGGLRGVRRAVVVAAGAIALAGACAGTAAAEPAPAHAGWDGSRYWFRDAAGAWRWTAHHATYLRRTGTPAPGHPAPTTGAGRPGEPVFRGRAGWDARDRVYWYRSRGHWYWTAHRDTYEQRTGLSGGGPGARPEPGPKPEPRPGHRRKPATPVTPPRSGQGRGWSAPVAPYVLTASYGQPGAWSKGYHTGQDFAVPSGTPVRAVGPGRVVTAGYGGAYGYQVVIRHPDGHWTQYAHLSRVDVSPGQYVAAGQRVARSGATGRVTGPHLHFEVRTGPRFGSDVNPLAYLRRHGVPV
ncbi:M23 family metallopeptidase [Streptomyces sp.]|uniref:M23 family metallopeptidase n=2 Tax=Streptomyces sp. TaxID=1931 RepID=UPI002810BBEC|nr:M23 family metallopeptidase [Streptomyces sp.]